MWEIFARSCDPFPLLEHVFKVLIELFFSSRFLSHLFLKISFLFRLRLFNKFAMEKGLLRNISPPTLPFL